MTEYKNGMNRNFHPVNKMDRLGGQSKKLSLKGFPASKTPADQFKISWDKLKKAVDAVFHSQSIIYTLEELYRDVENTCTIKMGIQLYDELKNVCASYVDDILPIFTKEETLNYSYLKTVAAAWELFCRRMLMIRSIFLFMDRQLAVHNVDILSLWDLGLSLFREKVVKDPRVRNRLLEAINHEIKLERQGERVDRRLIRCLVRMYSDLQLYKEDFEVYFLTNTRLSYQKEGQDLLSRLDVGEYLHHVKTRLAEEEDRVAYCLEASSRTALIDALITQLIAGHTDRLLNHGLVMMMQMRRMDQLGLLYTVLFMVPSGVDQLRKSFASYIKSTGRTIVENHSADQEKDKNMIQRLLDVKDELGEIVVECFQSNPNFHRAVNESFEEFINHRANKPAEYLAKFLDSKLRSGNKAQSEEELDKLMDKAMILFRFIHGKDVFEAFYTKELAKRLLMSKSASVDAEKAMLSKLKQECGPNYTKKMETMFQDIELSRQLSKNFRQYVSNQFPVDLSVNIICPASWPTYPQTKAVYPDDMLELRKEFSKFYTQHHQGRKLIYEPSLGTCVVRADFPTSPDFRKELQVSEYQALVLLQFNSSDPISLPYMHIQEATGIEEVELKRTLLSLAAGKGQKVLNKNSQGLDISPDTIFSFNANFRHKLTRIKFNQVQLKETKEEQAATEGRVFADRVAHVDCCLVRIMKMRKSIEHNALLTEAYNQLKFPLKATDVKKRIENLIERDYMKRDSANTALYHYIA